MSPRPADPTIRGALVDAAAHVLIDQGPQALTTRRVAETAGTSTMAVYTHFNGMPNLRAAVAEEGFARLRQYLERIPDTEDPVADVASLGGAYLANAFNNPHLYRLMFDRPGASADGPAVGSDTFDRLVAAVERAVEAQRFHGQPDATATQLWAAIHGLASLCLLGALPIPQAAGTVVELAGTLFVGFGDDGARARRSVASAMDNLPADVRSTLLR